MNWYHKFLKDVCNPTTGKARWFLVESIGAMLVIIWLAAALPIIGAIIGVGGLGSFEMIGHVPAIIGYNGSFIVSGQAVNYYYTATFFGIVILKFGLLMSYLGNNYRTGHVFVLNSPLGNWVKV